jgi:hypothetical protein
MPDVTFSCYWDKEHIKMAQNQKVIEGMDIYRTVCEKKWFQFKAIMKNYPEIFAPKFINKELFMNVFAQVCTRIFGDIDSSSLVPMADNMNHTCGEISYELISLTQQLEFLPSYFSSKKIMNNYSHIFEKMNILSESSKLTGRFNKE